MHQARPSLTAALAALATTALATTLLAVPVQAAPSATTAEDAPWKTVATGLDNPRLLSFSRGALYVAEAGRGGSGPCATGPEGGEVCLGLTGAITRITRHGSHRVVTGLPSLAGPDGGGATGPSDVVVPAHRRGSKHHFAATIGLGNAPEVRDVFGAAGRALGTVVTGNLKGGPVRVVADLAAHEQRLDPDGNGPDSNPTGLMRDGRSVVVTDSGANDLLRVRHHRRTRTLAVFPDTEVPDPFAPGAVVPMQPVPTSVVRGPDGAYYVSELTGFPFPSGGSRIWRVVRGEEPTVYATGLTNVTDLAWHRGSLYAVQLSTSGLLSEPEGALPSGSLVRVTPGAAPAPVAEGLPAPYGVALRGDKAYVTTCAVCPGGGSVVRIGLD